MKGEIKLNTTVATAALVVVLVTLTYALYWPVGNHDFVNYDDPVYVKDNPHVKSGWNAAEIRWALTASRASNWHPLTWWSHMLDVEWFGLNPRGHHFINLTLHTVNVGLLLLLVRRATGSLRLGALVAALFAWHPLHVESVAWISERKDVLSTFFGFLTLWFYTGYAHARRSGRGQPGWYYGSSVLCFALGLMAKPMLVTLPFVMLLWDLWPLRRAELKREAVPTWMKLAGEKAPFFLLAIASCVITYQVQSRGGAMASWDYITVTDRVINALVAYQSYLSKTLWPVSLAAFYPHPGHWPMATVCGATLLLLSLTGIATWQARRRPYLLVGWGWFLGTLIPVIGLVQVGDQAFADRYTYIPLTGIFLALAGGLREWTAASAWGRRAGLVIGSGMLVGCVLITRQQLRYWHDGEALWRHALAVTQRNYVAHNNLANLLLDGGAKSEAVAHYQSALAILPTYEDAHLNLGAVLLDEDKIAEAMEHFQLAVRLKPNSAGAHSRLAAALARQEKHAEAVAEYERAVTLNPEDAKAQYNLGISLTHLGKVLAAEEHFRAAVRLDPQYGFAHYNLGLVLAEQNQWQDAEQEFELAVRYSPEYVPARMQLGALLLHQARFAEAEEFYAAILRSESTNALAHNNLGLALARLGRAGEAAEHFKSVTRLEPNNADAHYNLANALAETGDLKAALFHYGEALRLNPNDERAREKLARLRGRMAADELTR